MCIRDRQEALFLIDDTIYLHIQPCDSGWDYTLYDAASVSYTHLDVYKRQPYWSWYGFDSRVEWCACFVSWCYGQSGRTEPRFAGCQSQGVPWRCV